ncbi:MAG: hypothetical protein AAFQ67_07370 [Pseudomonadota bacterium]
MHPAFAPAIIIAAVVFAIGVAALRWWRAKVDADTAYLADRESGAVAASVSESDYKAAYVSANGPRLSVYVAVAAVVAAIVLPSGLTVFNGVWDTIWLASGEPDVFARGQLPHSFATIFVYFGLILAISGAAMARYHSRRPPGLAAQLRELNGAAQ